MSHSTQAKIQIGAFCADIDLTLQYGSRIPAEALGVFTNKSTTFINEDGLVALDELCSHGYQGIISGCMSCAKNWQDMAGGDDSIDWLVVIVSHFD